MSTGLRVLVVEDDGQVMRFLRAGLGAHGYAIVDATTGSDALLRAAEYAPEIVLLDLGLPDIDGVEVIQKLRAWSSIPILVLSARDQESEKVRALDAGADDYVTKPFGFPELLARMRSALRRRQDTVRTGSSSFTCGPLRIELAERRVFHLDSEVHLTPIEYKLLAALALHPGKVLTHKQLLHDVWGPNRTDQAHYLRVHMTHLRRKLASGSSREGILRTEAGVGYRLQCPEEE
jgi:two-component system KDP operon response regulator KdpE